MQECNKFTDNFAEENCAEKAVHILETDIEIAASLQLVWSILDDLERYPEWNKVVTSLAGRTTLGEMVHGILVRDGAPPIVLSPTLTRIVGARELRWLSTAPDPAEFSAEHIFILAPTEGNTCHLFHNEIFTGPRADAMWDSITVNTRKAYNEMNLALKQRAESIKNTPVALHPAVAGALPKAAAAFKGATLCCKCSSGKVEVHVAEACSHNHLCGCSKCWKPRGALFAQIAVVPAGTLNVVANGEKLKVVDPTQSIQRYSCTGCETHMFGRVENKDHHFYGLDFIHPELSEEDGWPAPEFAAFVSSIIETGVAASDMQAVRTQIRAVGLEPYDVFSPELMDLISNHSVKIAKSRNTAAR